MDSFYKRVSPEGDLHYAALLGSSKVYGTEPFFGETPSRILELIRQGVFLLNGDVSLTPVTDDEALARFEIFFEDGFSSNSTVKAGRVHPISLSDLSSNSPHWIIRSRKFGNSARWWLIAVPLRCMGELTFRLYGLQGDPSNCSNF